MLGGGWFIDQKIFYEAIIPMIPVSITNNGNIYSGDENENTKNGEIPAISPLVDDSDDNGNIYEW